MRVSATIPSAGCMVTEVLRLRRSIQIPNNRSHDTGLMTLSSCRWSHLTSLRFQFIFKDTQMVMGLSATTPCSGCEVPGLPRKSNSWINCHWIYIKEGIPGIAFSDKSPRLVTFGWNRMVSGEFISENGFRIFWNISFTNLPKSMVSSYYLCDDRLIILVRSNVI